MKKKHTYKVLAAAVMLAVITPTILTAEEEPAVIQEKVSKEEAAPEAEAVPQEETAPEIEKVAKEEETPGEAPVQEAPTEAPVTEAPTEAPATEAPTETPATEQPQTETSEPTTEKPIQNPGTDLDNPKPNKNDEVKLDELNIKEDRETLRDKDALKDNKDVDYTPDERFTQIIDPETVLQTFRFVSVTKVSALAKEDNIRVYGDNSLSGIVVGTMNKDDICYVLQTGSGNWTYIESGAVRGFVKTTQIDSTEIADRKIRLRGEPTFTRAKALVDWTENPAWTFSKITSGETLVEKEYAIVTSGGSLNVREEANTEARIIGKIPEGGLCYVLADETEEWIFVESKDVRGFAKAEHLTLGEEAAEKVEARGEENFAMATELIEPEDNMACYYTLTSVKEARDEELEPLGNFTLTAYCSCPTCCGQWSGGPTASGAYPVQGRTVAMAGVEFGTKLVINGEVYTVEDRGTPYGHVDIYLVSHAEAVVFGRQYADTYLLKE